MSKALFDNLDDDEVNSRIPSKFRVDDDGDWDPSILHIPIGKPKNIIRENKGITGVVLGRFQVPYLHLGHIYLISKALQECDNVVVLLGCIRPETGATDERNPYTIHHRVVQITKIFGTVQVMYLYDYPGDDKSWSSQVDMLLEDYDNPVLYHSRDSFKDHYLGKYPTKEIPELPGYSGTELRKTTEK